MPDNLTPEQRKHAMSRVKQKDTDIEVTIRSGLHRLGYRFRKNVKTLPGQPDVVFSKERVAVFIDGDFWHGYRFPEWEHKVSDFWKNKINKNRARDRKNFRKLRRMGWVVIRIWQHEIRKMPAECIQRIITAVGRSRSSH
jgi:DNA mismatch endonuclease (patch repair protein)